MFGRYELRCRGSASDPGRLDASTGRAETAAQAHLGGSLFWVGCAWACLIAGSLLGCEGNRIQDPFNEGELAVNPGTETPHGPGLEPPTTATSRDRNAIEPPGLEPVPQEPDAEQPAAEQPAAQRPDPDEGMEPASVPKMAAPQTPSDGADTDISDPMDAPDPEEDQTGDGDMDGTPPDADDDAGVDDAATALTQ